MVYFYATRWLKYIPYHTVRYGTVRYGTVRYCTLYCTVLYCTVCNYLVLYLGHDCCSSADMHSTLLFTMCAAWGRHKQNHYTQKGSLSHLPHI